PRQELASRRHVEGTGTRVGEHLGSSRRVLLRGARRDLWHPGTQPAQLVGQDVTSDRVNPAREPRPALEALDPLIDLAEDLLAEVLRIHLKILISKVAQEPGAKTFAEPPVVLVDPDALLNFANDRAERVLVLASKGHGRASALACRARRSLSSVCWTT